MALTQTEIDALKDKIAKNAPYQSITDADRTLVLRNPREALESLSAATRKGRIRRRMMHPTKGLD